VSATARNIKVVGIPKCFLMRDHPVRSIKGGFAASFWMSRPPLLIEEGSWATTPQARAYGDKQRWCVKYIVALFKEGACAIKK
jgi:hypothetical protein